MLPVGSVPRDTSTSTPTYTSPHLSHLRRILSSHAGLPNLKDLFATHAAGQPPWICGRKDSHILHTLQSSTLADLAAPNTVAIAVAVAIAVSSSPILGRPLCLASSKFRTKPRTHRLARANLPSTPSQRRSLPRFLIFWDTTLVPLGLTPLILTTARRQFVPRNRRDEPANHTRARHSDKVSTGGRRDFLVPAQPKPAGAAYQRVHRTLPPRAKPEYIGYPSPSESDPAAPVHPALPCLACLTLLTTSALHALLCLSASYFYSPLAWPCLFLVTSFETEEATSNRQSSHPNPILTSPLSFSGAVQRLPLVQSHPSFLCLARPRATASLLHRRCSSPTGLVLSAPPIVRQTRTLRAPIPVSQRSFTAAQPVTKPACRMGSAFTETAPSQ